MEHIRDEERIETYEYRTKEKGQTCDLQNNYDDSKTNKPQ
jgi:hypothetical protein